MPSRETFERADPGRDAPREASEHRPAGLAEHVIGLQRSIGNRRTAALVAGAPARAISRYKILGPWNKGRRSTRR